MSERNVPILYFIMAVIYIRRRASVLDPRHHAASFDLLHPRHVARVESRSTILSVVQAHNMRHII